MKGNEVQSLLEKALEAHENENYAKAEPLFLEALYLLDDKENQLYQTIVYGLGINYAMQENYEGAKACFEEGRFNAQKAGNISFELEMLQQLITVCEKTEDWEAAEMLVEEEVLYREAHFPEDKAGLAVVFLEAARICNRSGQTNKSNEWLKKAVEQTKAVADERTKAGIWLGAGDVYCGKKEFEKAEEAYLASEKLYKRTQNKKALEQLRFRRERLQNLKKS